MGKVYLVEAWYENYESSWSKLIGIFDDIEVANNLKEKWDNFYKENKNIFDKPKDWEPVVDIGNYGSIEDDWTECMEYWTLKTKYEEIFEFNEIRINELTTNSDLFIENDNMFRTDPMKDLLSQYNRDYKLKEIL